MIEHHRQHAARQAWDAIDRYRRANPQATDVVRDRVVVLIAPQFGLPGIGIGTAPEVRREFARLVHWARDPSHHAIGQHGEPTPYVATFHVEGANWWIPEQEWTPAHPPAVTPPTDPTLAGSWYMLPGSFYPDGIPGR